MLLLALFFTGFAAALVAPVVVRAAPRGSAWILAAIPAAMTAALLLAAPWHGAEPATASLPWIPSLDLSLALRLDALSAVFALLVTGIGAPLFLYAGAYLGDHPQRDRFFAYLLLFMAAMTGVVLADHLLLLYVCWELTTLGSWLLIGFEHEDEDACEAAWQSLVVTSAGGLAMLAGLVLLGQAAGTWQISEVVHRSSQVAEAGALLPAMILLLLGAATKSALVPLHFWLPNAMAAPTPVSAYLHSATMVKAGIYLLARFDPLFAGQTPWSTVLLALGALTAVVAAAMALAQTDAKRLLAYTTIGALGMMTLALGIGGSHGARAALVLVVAHALYKGALFMVVGAVDHAVHSRDLRELSGLGAAMPITAAASVLAMISMVGLPPTMGFVAEEKLVEAALDHGSLALAAALAAGVLYTGAGFVVGLRPLVGRREAPAHRPAAGLSLPPLLLALTGVAFAFFLPELDGALISPATEDVAGHAPEEALHLWSGVTPPFLMGVGMLVVGGALAVAWPPLQRAGKRLSVLARVGPDRAYHLLEDLLVTSAKRLNALLQHGYLPGYLIVVMLGVIALAGPMLLRAGLAVPSGSSPIEPHDLVLLGVILGGALGACLLRSRLAIVASLTVVGYAVAVFFAIFGAPDLAITQVLVETLLTVLVVFLLPRIPHPEPLDRPATRARDALVASAAGLVVTALLLTSSAQEHAARAGAWYLEHTAAEGGGHNVVNKVLVEFRAADTLGEVTVLGAAVLSVMVLLSPRNT